MIWKIISFLLIVFNAYASSIVGKSEMITSKQKQMQWLLIWALPFIGAYLAWALNTKNPYPSSNKILRTEEEVPPHSMNELSALGNDSNSSW